MKRLGECLATMGILLSCGSRAVAGEVEPRLRDLLLNNHRASVQVIRTIICRVEIESGTGSAVPVRYVRGEYWNAGTDVRINEVYPDGRIEDRTVCDGRYLSIGHSKGASAASKGSAQDFISICDVRKQMLLNFPGKKSTRITLDDLLRWSGARNILKRIKQDGEDFIVVTATLTENDGSEKSLEIWFGASVNFLAKKMMLNWGDPAKKSKAIFEINSFVEFEPGVFFPTQSRTRAFRPDGELSGSMVCKLSNVKVNTTIGSDLFQLRIPAGTSMADRSQGTIYDVDAHGNPMGRVQPLDTKGRAVFQNLPNSQIVGQQTPGEGTGFWQWLVTWCLLVMASITVGVIVWQKKTSKGA